MAKPSRLEQIESTGGRFNEAADAQLEKRLQSHQLTQEERGQVDALRKDYTSQHKNEQDSFKKDFGKRFEQKYAEVAQRNGRPTPEHFPPGLRNRTMSPGQMRQVAAHGVKQDHDNKLADLKSQRDGGINNILKQANENGRGPEPSNQNDRTLSKDFNHDASQQNHSTTAQFNRSADHDR